MAHLASKDALRRQKVETITTPRGEQAFIRVMSGKERDEWMKHYRSEQAKAAESPCEAVYCPLLARTLSDEAGKRLYSDEEAAQLADVESTLLHELFEAALKVNMLGKESVETEKKD